MGGESADARGRRIPRTYEQISGWMLLVLGCGCNPPGEHSVRRSMSATTDDILQQGYAYTLTDYMRVHRGTEKLYSRLLSRKTWRTFG